MNQILSELKSLPGAILSLTVLLIATFWILNFIATRAPAPISGAAQWAETHASGAAYGI